MNSLNKRLGLELAYDEAAGNPSLLQRFVNGDWDEDTFLIIEPGKRVKLDATTCGFCAG